MSDPLDELPDRSTLRAVWVLLFEPELGGMDLERPGDYMMMAGRLEQVARACREHHRKAVARMAEGGGR